MTIKEGQPAPDFTAPATSDTTDNRVVWTCCKNNDGEKGPRTSWLRENGRFTT